MNNNSIKMNKIIIYFIFFISMGCTDQPTPKTEFKEGIILFLAPPDNCNGYILNIDKNLYYPSNLHEFFKKDSLLVEIDISETTELHNCGFGGTIPIATINHIKILDK